MSSFERNGLTFTIDHEGVTLEDSAEIEIEIDYETLAVDSESAPEKIGERLSKLTGAEIADEEGIFDLAVRREGELVAALMMACEDDALVLGGERSDGVSDEELAEALALALGGSK